MERYKIKKILFIFDSRATFSYSANVIKQIKKGKIKYQTLITGNYLDKKFGVDLNIFKKYKIKIHSKVRFRSSNIKKYSWSYYLGEYIKSFSKKISIINPDLIVLTGDRAETLAACISATYMNIPIAHIQAGDKSGHVDDVARAAISKMAHIHFASCEDSVRRLKNFGEDKKRIFNVGAPQLDDIYKFLKENKFKNFNIKSKKIVIIFHPVLNEVKNFKTQIKNLYLALQKFNFDYYWVYPNNDYGYKYLINFFKSKRLNKKFNIIKNLDRDRFLSLLSNSYAIIGNSSCGILEAPSFKMPVINIGTRQNKRPQAKNIINSSNSEKDIYLKMKFINENKKYLKNLKKVQNIFFKPNSSKSIINIIKKFKKNDTIFRKY